MPRARGVHVKCPWEHPHKLHSVNLQPGGFGGLNLCDTPVSHWRLYVLYKRSTRPVAPRSTPVTCAPRTSPHFSLLKTPNAPIGDVMTKPWWITLKQWLVKTCWAEISLFQFSWSVFNWISDKLKLVLIILIKHSFLSLWKKKERVFLPLKWRFSIFYRLLGHKLTSAEVKLRILENFDF